MRRVSLFIDETLIVGLDALKTEHGTPHAESIRRAIAAYLAGKGVSVKGSGKTRKQKRT